MHKDTILKFYAGGMEKDRLEQPDFLLEGLRTKQIISRYLTSRPLNILDIGGGTGVYSFWLKQLGHNVHLVDLSPEHIAWASEYAHKHNVQLDSCSVGDATHLDLEKDQFDIVLLLGPLYHLTERQDRIKALIEAKRVLKKGGVLLAAVISRYASLFDGFRHDLIQDDEFEKLVIQDLKTGIHVNTTDNPQYFTTASFHTPAEIKQEIADSGLDLVSLTAIESVGWMIGDLEQKIGDQRYNDKVQRLIALIESNEDLIALSPHIMAVTTKH
ncbi:class I SAM-dependent methyltransferase [Chitinophaga agrisoli]|uniref:Class I SAM-dependent methyltransferase n=1 Tax=Chitinophaga agrisoli TaxID=2607653 RepID=A0A5B2VZ87_9BACT|nr:class I SAM-dependent methyltransferase [Chitinophaga agrisoli]KAA2243339.1 class I SAM-dependent methyltransferase [Chitinophaga agrisoli]